MPFSLNPVEAIKSQIKAELHKHPEVKAALEKIDAGLKAIEALLRKVPASVYPVLFEKVAKDLIAYIEKSANVQIPLTDGELQLAAADMAKLPDGVHSLEVAVENAEKAID